MPEVIECTSIEVVENGDELDLRAFARLCSLETDFVVDLVEAGILDPQGGTPREWRFAASTLWRGRAAARLSRDLGLDAAALGIVLDLLEQRADLQRQMALLRALADAGES